jgi:hypothetical protein
LTLGAIWLALPQIIALSHKCPVRLIIAMAIGLTLVVIRPRAFPFVALIVLAVAIIELVGWILKPLPGTRKKPTRHKKR